MSYSIFEDGHISSPNGFRATGVSCGLKDGSKARDLALVYSTHPCKVAALFTTNVVQGATVFFNQAILARNRESIRAVLINAGQANVGTGQPGLADAVECAKLAATELEVPRDSVLLMSSGVIGVPLPMQRMRDGIKRAVSELDSGGGRRAAIAMLTTDSRPKERAMRVQLRENYRVTLAGMAKGTRLISPRLATLLCVITTDVNMEQRLLAQSLQESMAKSFHRLNLDGDSSPNDTVLLLANGTADGPIISDAVSLEYAAWREALDALTTDLAQQVVRDAAGSGKVLHVQVRGAPDAEAARTIAEAVARSRTLRRDCAQNQPRWEGLLAAVGGSGVAFRPDLLELRVGNLALLVEGVACPVDQAQAAQLFAAQEIEFTVDLHIGSGSATIVTCTWQGE
ncbi:MAG: bifunctional ornithine acetyltransferase/N-acetylglutamate synthase [Chloroflexaceae bacterium]|jgi:glutamate N-acetyltransferase/amino-acid N-acetyltransferase|nr:bifunctional ornithine acetyltransferase/N-acetylglutamate synthase [Chloroflexaceae bacterium]